MWYAPSLWNSDGDVQSKHDIVTRRVPGLLDGFNEGESLVGTEVGGEATLVADASGQPLGRRTFLRV